MIKNRTLFLIGVIVLSLGFKSTKSYAQSISGGAGTSVFLCTDGTVMACGWNGQGNLGDGTDSTRIVPVHTLGLSNIIAVASGWNHHLFLKYDGTVWGCGNNFDGQLGDSSKTNRNIPVKVNGLTNIIAISAGGDHSLFLKNDGTVWACGRNPNGAIGDGDSIKKYRITPVKVVGLESIIAIAGGEEYSLFLKNDGSVWACGSNLSGALGIGSKDNYYHSIAVQVHGIENVKAIAASSYSHSIFLKSDSTVWVCGRGAWGQLGNGSVGDTALPVQVAGLTNAIAIAAGAGHSLFLLNDGTVWSCGYNDDGQLGDGTDSSRTIPVKVNGLTGIKEISAGLWHSIFRKNDGSIWSCGNNGSGALGDSSIIDKSLPVQVINLCLVTFVEEIKTSYSIATYPNPSAGIFNLKIDNSEIRPFEIKIYNSLGSEIFSSSFESHVLQINLSNHSKGIYYINLFNGYNFMSRKIIIQ